MQEQSELLFLDQRSVLFRTESGSGADGTGIGRISLPPAVQDCNLSSAESFASAQDEVCSLITFKIEFL